MTKDESDVWEYDKTGGIKGDERKTTFVTLLSQGRENHLFI